ncbi:DsbA family oxidoreductase [Novosphingobium terrae]|uniref:DsbA family oxidoreductase n=1 Tax=Novosphingobium terrae TaxID=2726189 RepID=UPI0019812181|nr:DsbA family oxidoreductase [Novosphingobium terrae]
MKQSFKIDFVSDVSCPWCVIGLKGLETALEEMDAHAEGGIHFRPFELNPAMAPEGENLGEHIARKYGSTPEQSAANRAAIRERAGALGFTMAMSEGSRIYNTFDAHRLLHWAREEGKQQALKLALFAAYFTHGRDVSDHAVLVEVAGEVGLDAQRAQAILDGDTFASAVREEEALWRQRGINSVPAIIVNDRYLISGGQPAEAFEQALREIAKETA